jgi:hypothetical protein
MKRVLAKNVRVHTAAAVGAHSRIIAGNPEGIFAAGVQLSAALFVIPKV